MLHFGLMHLQQHLNFHPKIYKHMSLQGSILLLFFIEMKIYRLVCSRQKALHEPPF